MGWTGYLRKNGLKGIRNKILVIYTVKCSEFVAREIVSQMHHPDVELAGFDGCTDNQYAVRLLIALIRHPNVGGVLAVGLGCEYLQPAKFSEIALQEGKEGDWFYIQQEGGTEPSVKRGIDSVRRMLLALRHTKKVPMDFSDLIVGAECGGSDYTSGLAGNVLVGCFYDRLIDRGGTAIFEEIVEGVGLIDILSARAANERARQELICTYEKAMEYCRHVRQYSISPGNFAGGLSTIEEKSMGALIKSGSRPIQGVLKVGQRPPGPGLWLLDSTPDPNWMEFGITNPNDSEGLIDLIGSGAHIVFLVTGRGNVIGSIISPCIKITGNRHTFDRMNDDMDVDASPLLDGSLSQEELSGRLLDFVSDIASGTITKSEKLGHKEFYIPYKYQEKRVILRKNCR